MRVLIVVPARGGSKGLPGKNLRLVGDMSLVARAVRVGRQFLARTKLRGTVVVDTDDEAIAQEGRRWGADVPFLRPAALAGDATPMIENVLHLVTRLESVTGHAFDAVVLLQPTSPLRSVDDVDLCWSAFDPSSSPSVASVVAQQHPLENAMRLDESGRLHWRAGPIDANRRRQEYVPSLWLNGSVYINTPGALRAARAFVVSGVTRGVELLEERSIDVDTAADLVLADALAVAGAPEEIEIGGRRIGGDQPCFLIAEAGVNHNGDVDLAHRLIDVAADARVDAIKFQTFDPARLVSRKAAAAAYQIANTGRDQTQHELLSSLVLPRSAHAGLQQHARERGILFLSSPFDEASADLLEELGVPAFKVASGELTNHSFLEHLAAKGRPLLVSTGMAESWEVGSALDVIADHGAPSVALFHCVTSYPAAASDANLRAIHSMRAAFRVPVGWSDHTPGLAIALASVARGASLLEKHFTLDRELSGPDHKASLTPDELRELVVSVRAIESALGDGHKQPRPIERTLVAAARRSVHARRSLAAGQVVARDDLIALRPGNGISAALLGTLIGRRATRAIVEGELLIEGDLA